MVVLLGVAGAELIDIVLTIGLNMLVAGFVDGSGRRYRGPGVGFTTVGIIPRLFDSVAWLAEGWAFGLFLIRYGASVGLRRWRQPEVGAG